MASGECSKKAEKQSKKQQMAAEAIAIALTLRQNRGVNIVEPPMDAPHNNEAMNDRNFGPKVKGKEKDVFGTRKMMNDQNLAPNDKGKGTVVFDTGEMMNDQVSKPKVIAKTNGPKIVKFNALGQPVGKKAAQFAHFLSRAAKGFVPLTTPNFHEAVPDAHKDLIWNHVKKYYVVDDCHRKLCFQAMGGYWRQYKSTKIKEIEKRLKSADKIVAFGELASKEPDDTVHCIRLGNGNWKVWVREVIENMDLYRPTEEFSTLKEAKGSTVAWPSKYIKLL